MFDDFKELLSIFNAQKVKYLIFRRYCSLQESRLTCVYKNCILYR